jgi:hypothetical protein
MAGNVTWVEGNKLVEVRRKEEVGGKGGWMGGNQKMVTYEYFGNFAVKLCQADPEANSITRIWADRKIIYDRTGSSPTVEKYPSGDIRTYVGTSTQDPDPLIENEKGVGSTPAFRGSIYIVFELLPLKDFGNRIPMIEAEIQFATAVTTSEDSITSMTGWAIRNSQHIQSSFMLYLIRRHDAPAADTTASIHRYDIFDNALEKSSAANPYANEKGIGANGFRPLLVLPGDDGKLLVLGRNISNGFRTLVELNPITLQLLKVIDIHSNFSTGNEDEQACITWTVQDTYGVETFSMLFFDGEGGGGADSDNNDWVLVSRRALQHNSVQGIAKISFDKSRDLAGTGAMEPRSSTADKDGNLWVVGRHTNQSTDADGRRGLLFRVRPYLNSDTLPPIFFPHADEFDLTQYGVHDPYVVIYDRGTHSLIIMGDDDPITPFDQTWIRWSIDSQDVVVSRSVAQASTELPTWNGFGDPRQPNKNNFYTQNGFHNGTFYYNAQSTQWREMKASDLTTTIVSGPNIVGATITNDFWHQPTDSVFQFVEYNDSEIPVRFWRENAGTGPDTLDNILSQILREVRMDPDTEATFDTVIQNQNVDGFILAGQGTARAAIAPLSFAYLFDATESDGKLKFITRGGSAVRTIPQNDLGARRSGDGKGESSALVTQRIQEVELPERVDVRYMDFERDYGENNQQASRHRHPNATMESGSNQQQDLPIVMTADNAKKAAVAQMFNAWANRLAYEWSVGIRHIDLDPTDIVNVTTEEAGTVEHRIDRMELGDSYVNKMSSAGNDTEVFTVIASGESAPVAGQAISSPGRTEGFILDIPLLLDKHAPGQITTGIYMAFGALRETWAGGMATRSLNGNAGPFENFETSAGASPWGYLKNDIATVSNEVWDISTNQPTVYPRELTTWDEDTVITVSMVDGIDDLQSLTFQEVMDGRNAMVIQDVGADPEIVQYTSVTDIGGGDVELTGLIRGRRGTEEVGIQVGHPAGSRVVFLDNELTTRKSLELSEIGLVEFFRFKSLGEPFESFTLRSFTPAGVDLMPYPVNPVVVSVPPGATRTGNVTVTWSRRTRVGGNDAFLDGEPDVPLGESVEAYEVDLIHKTTGDISTTKYTTSDSTGVTFTSAERSTAGYPTAAEAFTVVIYQMSAIASIGPGLHASGADKGRGMPRRVTI